MGPAPCSRGSNESSGHSAQSGEPNPSHDLIIRPFDAHLWTSLGDGMMHGDSKDTPTADERVGS